MLHGEGVSLVYSRKVGRNMKVNTLNFITEIESMNSFQSDAENEFRLFHAWKQKSEELSSAA